MNNYKEIFPVSIIPYPKTCYGPKRHEKDVMLTIYDNETFYDVFLTQEQFDSLKDSINSFKQS